MSADQAPAASAVGPAALLAPGAIRLAERAADKTEAIQLCGQALVESGAVGEAYVPAMLEREASISTYIGEGVAIPHATAAGKDSVIKDALCFLRFPDGVDWDGATVTVCIGIAAKGGGHVDILAELAQILLDPVRAEALRGAETAETVLTMLTPAPDDEAEPTPEGER
jgi:PTS system mannitol-specific IIA component